MSADAGDARLFVGGALPRALAEALHGRCAAALRGAGWRVLAPEDLHLTFVFLGAVPVARIGELRAALEQELAGAAPTGLVFEATGAFPSRDRPRVAWAGGPRLSAATYPLHARCHAAVRRLGLAREPQRPPADWTAHVTLARPPRGARARLPRAFLEARLELSGTLAEVGVFESRGAAAGERYPVRARVPLMRTPA